MRQGNMCSLIFVTLGCFIFVTLSQACNTCNRCSVLIADGLECCEKMSSYVWGGMVADCIKYEQAGDISQVEDLLKDIKKTCLAKGSDLNIEPCRKCSRLSETWILSCSKLFDPCEWGQLVADCWRLENSGDILGRDKIIEKIRRRCHCEIPEGKLDGDCFCVVDDGTTIPFGTVGYVTSDCLQRCNCTDTSGPECENLRPCHEKANCVNDGDSHKCQCDASQNYTGDGYQCLPINNDCVLDDGTIIAFGTVGYVTSDCLQRCNCTDAKDPDCENIAPCHEKANCVDDGDSHKCQCDANQNVTGDGYQCFPITPVCLAKKLDVMFVVDTSASLSDLDFHETKSFVKDVVSRMDVSADNTHIGVISFNNIAMIQTTLSGNLNNVEIMDEVDDIPPPLPNGMTNTHLAIKEASEIFSDKGRNGTTWIMIIVTDGKSTEQLSTVMAMKAFNWLFPKVLVIVIGVGDKIDMGELQIMATGKGDANVMLERDYTQLLQKVDKIATDACAADGSAARDPHLLMYIPGDAAAWLNNRLLDLYDIYHDNNFAGCNGASLWVGNTYYPFTVIRFVNGTLEVWLYDDLVDFCTQSGTLLAYKTGVTDIYDAAHNDWQVTDATLTGVLSSFF